MSKIAEWRKKHRDASGDFAELSSRFIPGAKGWSLQPTETGVKFHLHGDREGAYRNMEVLADDEARTLRDALCLMYGPPEEAP